MLNYYNASCGIENSKEFVYGNSLKQSITV